MNIKRQFIDWMESQSLGTFGITIFIGIAPLGALDECYIVTSGGGNPIVKNNTGERQKGYILNVYFRSLNAETVDEKLQALEELINESACLEIDGYDIIEAEATAFPTDQDIDNEDRTVGLLQITLTVYK